MKISCLRARAKQSLFLIILREIAMPAFGGSVYMGNSVFLNVSYPDLFYNLNQSI
jgi:hypothetical protein